MRNSPGFRIVSFLFVLLVGAAAAFAGGRVRNGGVGMECGILSNPAGTSIRLLDVFERDLPETWSEARADFANAIHCHLAETDRAFADAWRAEWDRLGDSAEWSESAAERSFDEYLPFDPRAVSGCRLVQLSLFDESANWTPRRIVANWTRLTERGRRALELHESLHVLAVRDYAHTNPVRVRALVGGLLARAGGGGEMPRLLEHFQNRAPMAATRDGFYVSTGGDLHCPPAIALEDTRIDGEQILFGYRHPYLEEWRIASFRFTAWDEGRWNQRSRYARSESGVETASLEVPGRYVEITLTTESSDTFTADFRFTASSFLPTSGWQARECRYRRDAKAPRSAMETYFRQIMEGAADANRSAGPGAYRRFSRQNSE